MIAEPGQIVTDKWGNVFMPLSVKGIVEEQGKIWLRRNEWRKWDLSGGRVDGGEQPAELAEALNLPNLPELYKRAIRLAYENHRN